MTTQSLFKMDSVTAMIESAGEQERDYCLFNPGKFSSYSLEKMTKLVAEYNTNRLVTCRIAGGIVSAEDSEAQVIIDSKMEEVKAVAERLIRCVNAGIELY